jgi:hypothetical protein
MIETTGGVAAIKWGAMIGGIAGALYAQTGLPPMPWYWRVCYFGLVMVCVYFGVEAIAAYEVMPKGAYGLAGFGIGALSVPLLKWSVKAASDPLAVWQRLKGGGNG